ncbi:mechanosensitive ion channel family protein [Emticicia sp. BO119]|uniref:mechanosensitive ion channel family protein n=1 Tax=Emticicia sp. BO119 TaxID=2757768 RepID=UPI0015F0CA15|nr:mechanosensitive ion channel domain-containing protein [Emticicia sp. BO119]MBA4849855.1 mechanosensitive ion channel family protein [Emticicia sp. BO119]
MDNFLRTTFLYNTAESWLWFLGIIIIGFLFKRILSVLVSQIVYRMMKKETKSVPLADFVNLLRSPVEFLLALLIIYMALNEIIFPRKWRIIPFGKMRFSDFIDRTLDMLFVAGVTWLIIRLVRFFGLVYLQKAEVSESNKDRQLVPFFRDIIIVIIAFSSFFLILGFVFKQDVISLITGLGIGGVALALAARATLENLFASFTLFTEQPFIVGDAIELGTMVGTVEKVGFRSTRIRHVDGSLIVVPNQMLVSQSLNNISQRMERRHKFFIRLKLEASIQQIKEIIEEVQTIIDNHESISTGGRAKLDAIGDYSINILVVFMVTTADYWESKNIREEVNLAILNILEKKQVELAQPTTTLFGLTDDKNIDNDY